MQSGLYFRFYFSFAFPTILNAITTFSVSSSVNLMFIVFIDYSHPLPQEQVLQPSS